MIILLPYWGGGTVQSAIDELASSVNTINNNLKMKTNNNFIRCGNVVEFTLTTYSGGNILVPEGYRPCGLRHFLFHDNISNKEVDIYYDYKTYEMVIPSNVSLYGCVTYMSQ